MAPSHRPHRIFYGYYLIAVTFLLMALFNGSGVFVFSLFVRPLGASLGWSRGEVMAGFTIFYAMVGVGSPIAGRFVNRYGVRPVIPAGALLMSLGFVIVSQMSVLPLFYLGYAIVGIGAAAMGPVPCSAVMSNWFNRRRGLALGLMSAGIGAGGVVMAPFIGYMLSNFDWRTAYLSMAVLISAVSVPLSLATVHTRPSDMGLYPDGDAAPDATANQSHPAREATGFTLRQALGTVAFWLIAMAFFFNNFANMGMIQSSAPHLEDIGYPTTMAASALGAIGLGSGVGKILFGWLCDRIRASLAFAIGTVMQLIALLMLLTIVHAQSPLIIIWAYAILLGLGVGAWFPTLSMLAGANFGLLYYGTVFGAVNLCQSLGTAGGPLFAGTVHDVTGSYYGAFITAAVLLTVSIPAILMVKKPTLPTSPA